MDGVNGMGNNGAMEKLPDKKIFFVIGIFFGILVLLSAALLILSNVSRTKTTASGGAPFTNRQNGDLETNKASTTAPQVKPTSAFLPAPKFQTKQWTVSPRTQPSDITTAQQYAFKQNYTTSEIRTFTQKLFIPQVFKTTNNQVIAYTIDATSKDTEAMRFQPQTGTFSFMSTKGVPLTVQAYSIVTNDLIYSFLKSIDLYDPAMQVTAQYKNSEASGATYYEIHRDWKQMGLPILNLVGLMNLPESQGLADLSLSSSAGLPGGQSIAISTDGRSGLLRPNDFNTITVIIDDKTKKVIGMESTMRKIDPNKTETRNLITYKDAVDKLKNNRYELIFNSPSGGGVLPWTKIYPGNVADATNAIVTDAVYTYLEQPPVTVQNLLKPYILFKGYATLANGYRSDFVAAIPADQSVVLGASTYNNDGNLLAQQQQGNTYPPTVDPTIKVPVPTVAPECEEEHMKIAPFQTVIKFMDITLAWSPSFDYWKEIDGVWKGPYTENNGGHGDWYYLPPENFSKEQLTSDLQKIQANLIAFMNAIGYTGGEGFRQWEAVWNDVNHTWGDDRVNYDWNHRCPIRLTGHSPTLFLYGEKGQSVQVYPSHTLYVDPALNSNSWNTLINGPYDLIVNGVQRPYLYYEYSSISFSRPKAGWLVDKNNLDIFADRVGTQLGLNTTEKDRLAVEFSQGAALLPDDKIFVGLIDNQELNKKLPLTMNPVPSKVYRFHFFFGPVINKVPAPKLAPLQRTNFMAVELGVYSSQ